MKNIKSLRVNIQAVLKGKNYVLFAFINTNVQVIKKEYEQKYRIIKTGEILSLKEFRDIYIVLNRTQKLKPHDKISIEFNEFEKYTDVQDKIIYKPIKVSTGLAVPEHFWSKKNKINRNLHFY